MHPATSKLVCAVTIVGLLISGGCGGSSDGGPQVPVGIQITPTNVAFGAIGSTLQLSAKVVDANGATVSGAPAIIWSRAGTGATASVSASGLVSALGVGASDTVIASASGFSARAAISVTQVVAAITNTNFPPADTVLRTTGSTKQFTAVAFDSNNNVLATQPAFTWTSSLPAVATVSGSGLVTAVSDGTTIITASAGGKSTGRQQSVQRFAKTFSLSPNTPQSIATSAGTIIFTGTAQDSAATNLTITWTSRNTAVLTMSPASGTSGTTSTATAKGNGTTFVVLSGGTRSDSAQVTTSNQSTAPMTASVTVGDDFFASVHNSTSNPAVDTIAAGGTVTWTWGTSFNPHAVRSTGTPSFTSESGTQTGSGKTFQVTFATPGTYTYDCSVHGAAMTGRIVVR